MTLLRFNNANQQGFYDGLRRLWTQLHQSLLLSCSNRNVWLYPNSHDGTYLGGNCPSTAAPDPRSWTRDWTHCEDAAWPVSIGSSEQGKWCSAWSRRMHKLFLELCKTSAVYKLWSQKLLNAIISHSSHLLHPCLLCHMLHIRRERLWVNLCIL